MSYDHELAERVRQLLSEQEGIVERTMFGGLAFLLGGHMCCGVVRDQLMVRVGPESYEQALAEPHAREMDFAGRPLRGFVYVEPSGIASAESLNRWVEWGRRFALTLPG
jgi:TfoX/Sxy family transcriptional regulator of competence genes